MNDLYTLKSRQYHLPLYLNLFMLHASFASCVQYCAFVQRASRFSNPSFSMTLPQPIIRRADLTVIVCAAIMSSIYAFRVTGFLLLIYSQVYHSIARLLLSSDFSSLCPSIRVLVQPHLSFSNHHHGTACKPGSPT